MNTRRGDTKEQADNGAQGRQQQMNAAVTSRRLEVRRERNEKQDSEVQLLNARGRTNAT